MVEIEQLKRQLDDGLRAAAGALRQQGREAAARRRAAAGRAQDGQGVRRGEAQAAAGRQDGRPARQQGRDLEDRADRGHAASRGRHAGRHRAQPVGRALADERRPDPGDPSRLGLQQSRPRASAGCSTRCRGTRSSRALRERLAAIYGDGAGIEGFERGRAGRACRQSARRRAGRDAGVRRRARGRHPAAAGRGRAAMPRAR